MLRSKLLLTFCVQKFLIASTYTGFNLKEDDVMMKSRGAPNGAEILDLLSHPNVPQLVCEVFLDCCSCTSNLSNGVAVGPLICM